MQEVFERNGRDLRFIVVPAEKIDDSAVDVGIGYFLAVEVLDDFYVKKIVHHDVNDPLTYVTAGEPMHCFDALCEVGKTLNCPPVYRLAVVIAKEWE